MFGGVVRYLILIPQRLLHCDQVSNVHLRGEGCAAAATVSSGFPFAHIFVKAHPNLRRALDAVTDDAKASADSGFKALIDGVDITERAMLSALERHGVKKLAPEGEKFDPNFHQAMFEVPDETKPANTVVQVVQDGYIIGERMLRPAMVGVSKGGPKAATEPGPVDGEAAADA